jgi:hypothetical protein
MPNPIKALVLKGDFTEAEFTELVALLRRFDTDRPQAQLHILMIDPAIEWETAAAMIERALPEQEGRETELLVLPTPRKWAPP